MGDEQKTEMYSGESWLTPVLTLDDLPEEAEEGVMCFVRSTSAAYVRRDGSWEVEIENKPKTS